MMKRIKTKTYQKSSSNSKKEKTKYKIYVCRHGF